MQPREPADERGFSNPIRPHETNEITGMDLQIQFLKKVIASGSTIITNGRVRDLYYDGSIRNHTVTFLFRMITQITTGAPIKDVIALIGSICALPGSCVRISQNNISEAPPMTTAGISTL